MSLVSNEICASLPFSKEIFNIDELKYITPYVSDSVVQNKIIKYPNLYTIYLINREIIIGYCDYQYLQKFIKNIHNTSK